MKRYITSFIISVLSLTAAADTSAQGLDTTRVRETRKIKKSFGEIVADIPGEILKSPFYVAEFVTHTIATNPPVSEVTRLIDVGTKARKYIPIVGYNSRAGVKFGIGLRRLKKIAPTDHIKGKVYYSTNDYQSYLVKFRIEKLFTQHLGLDLYFRYKKRPRESFYGLGIDSRKDKEASYTFENTEFKVEIPLHTDDRIYFSAIGGYQISNLYDGRHPEFQGDLDSIFADSDFALEEGRLDGSRYVAFGGSFEYDGRDNHGQPSRGTHLYARFMRFAGVNRSEGEDFSRYSLDLRQYLHVWRKRILAFRAYLQRFDANDANERATPIYMTSTLGGIDVLRGYVEGRFRDNDLALASIEYRYPIYDFIDAFLFVDEGRVYEKMTDEKFFQDWKYSFGFGLRLWNPRDVTAMAQVARSKEGTRFYFELGATW